MIVSANKPFQLVYALFQHQYLGFLFESFVIQLNEDRKMTLQYQNISAQNASEFATGMAERDYKIIGLMDSIQPTVIANRFSTKKMKPDDFFLKVYDTDTGDKKLQETIHQYIEAKRAKILPQLRGKLLFVMERDGNPAGRRLIVEPEPASLLFHFRRNHESTLYFPTMKHHGEKVEFQNKSMSSMLICTEPAWLMVNNKIYTFEGEISGGKLRPFLRKKNIIISKKIEDTYFRKFVAPLVETCNVYAKGFDIQLLEFEPAPILSFAEWVGGDSDLAEVITDDTPHIVFKLLFRYDKYEFPAENPKKYSVEITQNGETYAFYKIRRETTQEEQIQEFLQSLGLPLKNGKTVLKKNESFEWLNKNTEKIQKESFIIQQSKNDSKRYFLGKSMINLQVSENRDWFDVYAKVMFGKYEIPFIKLRKMILNGKREFTLPNGEIAVIPEAWFTQYADIFTLMSEENQAHHLEKHHLALLQELENGNYAQIRMNRKLEKLRDFEQIEDIPLPQKFNGELRPYQKAGYNWLQFLNAYHFGGCLADDMGLGKTVQTLALLQDQKEKEAKSATLLVMPTSLLYNWEMEARKFTPELKILNYTGTNRLKNTENFNNYDVVITSYGIVRIDISILEKYYFNYIILDESQAIKNPNSNISKAVRQLNSEFRLILTGTPIENGTTDLWSQMNFINPGLLGNLTFFKNHFQTPIEKRREIDKMQRLHAMIKPFILRRKKSQVATELPEKVENIHYSQMTESQKELYEEVKSYYRNKILNHIEENGVNKSQIMLLQGLVRLRQIANHPRMQDENSEADSGKMDDIIRMLEAGVSENHKILVFSQFVKHLSLLRTEIEARNIRYAYLDGSTKNRKEQVHLFQKNADIPIFLISLKAGGVGLNLTAADYVFILDPWWNPAVEAQAIDRAHRIGQENKVLIYKFIAQNTVEEKILRLQQNKIRLADELINSEDGFVKSLSKEDIEDLLM